MYNLYSGYNDMIFPCSDVTNYIIIIMLSSLPSVYTEPLCKIILNITVRPMMMERTYLYVAPFIDSHYVNIN